MWLSLGVVGLVICIYLGRKIFRPNSFTSQIGKVTNLHAFDLTESSQKLYLINIYVKNIGDVRLNNESLYIYASLYDTVITEFQVRQKFFKKEFKLQKVILLTGEIFPVSPESLVKLPK